MVGWWDGGLSRHHEMVSSGRGDGDGGGEGLSVWIWYEVGGVE